MSSDLKKCIDITPNGVLKPGSRQDYLWLRAQPWWEEILVDTRYIRFWIDRPSLQGDATNYPLGEAPDGSIEAFRLQNLDAQIRAANADKLKVILLPYRYPLAANGTATLPVENRLFEPEDRVRGNAGSTPYLPWFYDRRRPAPQPKGSPLPPSAGRARPGFALGKSSCARCSSAGSRAATRTAGPTSSTFATSRTDSSGRNAARPATPAPIEGHFGRQPSARVPDRTPSTSQLTVHKAVAEMMQTVDQFARFYHPRVLCFAPSTADSDVTATGWYRVTSKFAATRYSATLSDPFVPALLDELDRLHFKGGGRWLWWFHNYNDWSRAEDRVAQLRPSLNGRWRGRTDDLGDPALVATEGGCRLNRVTLPTRFPASPGKNSSTSTR